MRHARSLLVVVLLCAGGARAVPGVPVLTAPLDGGWASRTPYLEFNLPFGTTPPETVGVQLEVRDPNDVLIDSDFEPRSGYGAHEDLVGAALPDAGYFTWRARGVDDAGLTSVWVDTWFRVDGEGSTSPAPVLADLDGGFLQLTCAPVTDSQSGMGYYHFGLSSLDQVDGGLNYGAPISLTPTAPQVTTLLGPGAWFAGVHTHDAVGNSSGPSSVAGPLLVAASAALPQSPTPSVVRSDGGVWQTYPYLPTDFVRLSLDPGPQTGVLGYAVVRRGRAVGSAWEPAGSGAGPVVVVSLPQGDQDVRVAMVVGNEVAAWSNAVQVWVDEYDPLTPLVSAAVDAGVVTLRWPPGRDHSSGNSGVVEYRMSRACDAGTFSLGALPFVADAGVTFLDVPPPGTWTYSVVTVDRVGRTSTPASPVVPVPPLAPSNLRVAPLVTSAPVLLAWDDERDGGGPALTWEVTRFAADGTPTSAATGLSRAGFSDDAPEGRWSYEVVARVGALVGPPARQDGVVRDTTPPDVVGPTVQLVGARMAEVSWSVTDALAGVASVTLERESNSVAATLGAQPSPHTEVLPDGLHRYRVVATDTAGNVVQSAWTAPFTTPGAGVQILPPAEVPEGSCGRAWSLDLEATEPATWALMAGPAGASLDADTGVVTWTPTADEVGPRVVTVRAQAGSGIDQREVSFDVTCTPRTYGAGCGCGATEGLWLAGLSLLALARRRR